MAEGLALAGAAASIIQIIHTGTVIADRIHKYSSACCDLPEIFKHVEIDLRLIVVTLEKVDEVTKTNCLDEPVRKALLGVVQACQKEAKELEKIVLVALPNVDDTSLKRTWKAIGSLSCDDKVRKKTDVIKRYVQTLHFSIDVSSATGSLISQYLSNFLVQSSAANAIK